MSDTVKRLEEGFDNFMDHYREMDADEFIKELEEAGVSFVPCDGKAPKKSSPKITPCTGEGQGSCKRCNDHGLWNRHWMCFLYEIEGYEGCYCSECVKKIMEVEKNEG